MTARVPELQKLKERILALEDSETDGLRIWLNGVADAKREMSRPKTPKPQTIQAPKGQSNEQTT